MVVTPKTEVSFQYDSRGRRTAKRVIRWEDEDGDSTPDPSEEQPPRVTRYLYDGDNILATFTETGRERARYTHGPGIDEPLAELHRKVLTFYHADVLRSVIALTDASGQPLRQYHYESFGLPEEARGDRQPFRFTAREWDKELKLYFYRARYYDPRNGRFLQEDPLGPGLGQPHGYAYVRNRPLTLVDPLGLYESPGLLRAVVPGQGAWDYAMTGFEAGDYGKGALGLGTMLGEQALFVLTLGQAGAARECAISATEAGGSAEGISSVVEQGSTAVLKNGYYEVNGFKFSEYYYNKLWDTGRGAPSLVAKEILDSAKTAVPDAIKQGFLRYEAGGWEMVYNPITREVWHLQPIK